MTDGGPWSEAENAATVASYLSMLKRELAGEPYTKTAENERLRSLLNNRTKGAVELKYQNVSAVMIENGWRPINGYKPMRNVQARLREEVLRVVEGAEDAVVGVAADADVMKALPAAAGRALVGSVTASSDC